MVLTEVDAGVADVHSLAMLDGLVYHEARRNTRVTTKGYKRTLVGDMG